MNHTHTASAAHARRRSAVTPRTGGDADDLALLQALSRGDEQAFWRLWLKHSPRLFAVCYRERNRNQEDAEDALHETMLRAHAKMPRFATRILCPASWLNRMASNVCKDLYRRQARASRVAMDAVMLAATVSESVETAAPATECDAATLIARLPHRLRDVFVLRVMQEMSYGDIAARLGVTCVTARKRVQQSREALRAWRTSGAA
jgi:RNA polymerase sigma factor (sigma-70 family)